MVKECDKSSATRVTRSILPDSGVVWEGTWWEDFGWFEFGFLYAIYDDVI